MGAKLPDDLEGHMLALIREKLLETGGEMTPASDLFAAGLDSMGIMQMMIAIEERYGLRIPEGEVTKQNFSNVSNLSALIRRCQTSA